MTEPEPERTNGINNARARADRLQAELTPSKTQKGDSLAMPHQDSTSNTDPEDRTNQSKPDPQARLRELGVWRKTYLAAGLSPLHACGPDHDCGSPGKVPHIPDWSRYGDDPMSDDEFLRRFNTKSGGNLSLALGGRLIAIDIDKRSGGHASWDEIAHRYDVIPETPHAFTGGDGEHYLFLLPEGERVPAGGSLEKVNLPGVEWKAAGVQALVEAASRSGNPAWRERLLKVISHRMAFVQETHSFPSPTDDELLASGEAVLGNVLRADYSLGGNVFLSLDMFPVGVIIVGTTGAGKSTILFSTCDQVSEHARVITFDREDEARTKLAGSLRRRKFRYLHYRDLKHNLLEPVGGETPREMVNRLISYWRTELTLGDGSENILAECIYSLLEEHGVLSGGKEYPTLWHLQNKLVRIKPRLDARQRAYWETAFNRISVLLTLMGDVYDTSRGFDLEVLLDQNLVIDLQGISDSHHRFLVSDLFSCTMAIRERRPQEHVVIFAIDELHRYARSGPSYDPWEPYIHTVARLGRKRGIGILVSDQVPSQIPSAVMANMSTRIAVRTVNGPCKETIGRSMSLSAEQRDWLSEMPMRVAVVHSLFHPRPFAIAIPEQRYDEALSDEELRALRKEFLAELSFEPRKEQPSTVKEEKNGAPALPKEVIDYMVAVDKNPFLAATERDAALGITAYKGVKLRSELKKRGLATEHRVSLFRRGKNLLLLDLTAEAYEVFRTMKIKRAEHRGKGGVVHRFWQYKVRESVLAEHPDWLCVIEDGSTGKAVDVSVNTGEKRIAIEVCIKNGTEFTNIARDKGYDEIIVAAENETTLTRIRKASEKLEIENDRVSYRLLSTFVKE